MKGESSKDDFWGIYYETFTMLLEPGKDDYVIYFQMQPENLEYRKDGDIVIRVPAIMADRNQPVYQMDIDDILDIMETKTDSLLPCLSSIMVDENPLFTPTLYIKGNFFHEKYNGNKNYNIRRVQPTPEEIVNNNFSWEEEVQWMPRIVFHDLDYDMQVILKNWIGGILLAVGSGLIIFPISDWLNLPQKRDKKI